MPRSAVLIALLAAAAPATSYSQIALTPSLGAFIPASDFDHIVEGAEQGLRREGTLALGLNLELGSLRGSLAYATGTTIKDRNDADIGKGTLLAGAADLVIRPLPRVLLQPYAVLGVGFKNQTFDRTANTTDPFPADQRKLALHGGAGADLMLGGIGVMAELTDYLSKDEAGGWKVHDAFFNVGLRLRF